LPLKDDPWSWVKETTYVVKNKLKMLNKSLDHIALGNIFPMS